MSFFNNDAQRRAWTRTLRPTGDPNDPALQFTVVRETFDCPRRCGACMYYRTTKQVVTQPRLPILSLPPRRDCACPPDLAVATGKQHFV